MNPDIPLQSPVPLVRLRGLGKLFGKVVAVDGIDLDLMSGTVTALLGPNGAGKTTTIRMLMGQMKPTTGSAQVDGLDCFTERAQVMALTGYVPDEPVFHDYLTGRELIRFVGALHGLDEKTIGERAKEWVERLRLGDAIDDFAVNYSKGMRKKLALILALVSKPRLLICDEPANGLDPHASRDLLAIIRELATTGVTVLFSTHLLDQAEKIADRAAIIARGRLIADGPIAELRTQAAAGGSLEEAFFALTAAVDQAE
jgi:ABC-2 type transport system ATP-binding protein